LDGSLSSFTVSGLRRASSPKAARRIPLAPSMARNAIGRKMMLMRTEVMTRKPP
jgi:hypothetical protein